MPDVAKNLQGPEMYLCANFGRSSPDGLRGDQGQRHRQRDILCIIKENCSEDIKVKRKMLTCLHVTVIQSYISSFYCIRLRNGELCCGNPGNDKQIITIINPI